ncbi:hypothetical protein CYMTET_27147 [Cymbomonas tetramitiformis]|uniref:Uncharacterized protein n=1 Tax=Cymbomonas tetramitiformis TaxID=36881 RepID=A0AAE0KXA2_9CHLO|nr:hypothetical protein CYMTET_27147 [Cymbomonas tetramitiformis]
MSDMNTLSGQSSGGQVGITVTGDPILGNTLRILGGGPLAQSAMAQWHRVTDSGALEIIAGATRVQYAPEPRDMGYQLSCMLTPPAGGKPLVAVSSKKITMSGGLHDYVNTLMVNGGGEFNVVIVQLNGAMQDRRSVFQLEVLPSKLKIKKGTKTKYKENYNDSMQVCGARGGGDAAAQGLFLALSSSLVFMLACESSRERNAAIMLIHVTYLVWDMEDPIADGNGFLSKRIDLSVDIQQWQTLASLVQHFLKMLLSFFASADSCVAENLAQRLMRDPETSLEAFFFFFFFFFFYGFQLKIENVHSEVCNLFIDALIKDPD